jgi:hypothetical protein
MKSKMILQYNYSNELFQLDIVGIRLAELSNCF